MKVNSDSENKNRLTSEYKEIIKTLFNAQKNKDMETRKNYSDDQKLRMFIRKHEGYDKENLLENGKHI